MDGLPNELLLSIFDICLGDGSRGRFEVCAILKVCKRWYQLAISILWRQVQLDDSNLTQFIKYANSKRRYIKSLALRPMKNSRKVRFNPYQRPNKTNPRASQSSPVDKVWFKLATSIHRMDKLSSLSLCVTDDELCHNPSRNCFGQYHIWDIISHLPQSVQNLEISVKPLQHFDLEAQTCLCSAIAGVIPQLKVLRLSVPGVCPCLISASPRIQSIVINICWSYDGHRCLCQPTSTCETLAGRPMLETDARITFIRSVHRQLVVEPDKMPALQRFVLVSTHNFDSDACGPSHLLLRDDLLSAQTTAFPLWCVNDDDPEPQELWSLRIRDTDDPDKRDIIGSISDLELAVEQSAYEEGTPEHRKIEAKPWASTLNTFMKPSSVEDELCGLWKHEKQAKSCLLAPEIVPLGLTPELNRSIYGRCPELPNEEEASKLTSSAAS